MLRVRALFEAAWIQIWVRPWNYYPGSLLGSWSLRVARSLLVTQSHWQKELCHTPTILSASVMA